MNPIFSGLLIKNNILQHLCGLGRLLNGSQPDFLVMVDTLTLHILFVLNSA